MAAKKIIPCEVYSRIVGYHRPIKQWNKGKRQEFSERVTFTPENSLKSTCCVKTQ